MVAIPDTYHALKASAHLPFAIYLELVPIARGTGDVDSARLEPFFQRIAAVSAAPPADGLTAEQVDRERQILDQSRGFLAGVAEAHRVTLDGLQSFARTIGPLLKASADDAGCIQVRSLHEHVEKWRAAMAAAEWDGLRVVVRGSHQARFRNVATQYFARRLDGDRPSFSYPGESERVVYAESLRKEETSLDLLATVQLDLDASEAFFGNEWRLTEDILSDGAARCVVEILGQPETTTAPSARPPLDFDAVTAREELAALVVARRTTPGALKHYDVFDQSCALPFPAVVAGATSEAELRSPIDLHCPHEGTAKSSEGAAQNRAKNNFCATGAPVRLTVADFKLLQQIVDQKGIPYGASDSLPPDRDELEDLIVKSGVSVGEGTVVELLAFVDDDTRYSGTPETVNCKYPTNTDEQRQLVADVHLELAESFNSASKDRVSAEITPHFRMPEWTPSILVATREGRHPVRIRGQLFFDGAHKPCNGPNDCYRSSSWEIHPVYEIAVCGAKSLSACRQPGASWTELELWDPE